MAYKKKTLRRMHPTTRRYARILNDLDSVPRRLRNLTEDIRPPRGGQQSPPQPPNMGKGSQPFT